VLVTGPTGSGKSTSLYAMLSHLRAERQAVVNISTIEDPVEFPMPRVNQVTVNPAFGVDFAAGLRALLRQDPDIIMVGEIRDRETAEIAVRSALVGRLVLSTLHTNDAVGAVARLFDMGVEAFLLASTLSLVIGQRLVRRTCEAYRESVEIDPPMLAILRARRDFEATVGALRAEGILGSGADPFDGVRLFRGRGCAQCSGTGCRGRLGIYETFAVDDEVRTLMMERRPAADIRRAAMARGMRTMLQDGFAKALLGETTVDEVYRVTA
jgi:type II secretory ATPase GspE/PulE/Tfp pilus assembly ATPase PilB-like protein